MLVKDSNIALKITNITLVNGLFLGVNSTGTIK